MKKTVFIFILFFSKTVFSQSVGLTVLATGRQAYCPSTQISIVTSFSITNTTSGNIDAFYIQISQGYQASFDKLIEKSFPDICIWASFEIILF